MDGKRGTSTTPSTSVKDDTRAAEDNAMTTSKPPSMWKKTAQKLGLSIPFLIMMFKYVTQFGVFRFLTTAWGNDLLGAIKG
jgi:hypothetical protein